MRPILTIVDDFLREPDKVRAQVISGGFSDVEFQGSMYHTVNVTHGTEEILPRLTELFGGPVKMHVGAWRQGKKSSPVHNAVHADNSCAQMAAVLYLNRPEDCFGGTAFWRHRLTGWESMPSEEQLAEHHFKLEEFAEDWHNFAAWEQTFLAPMKYNRLITYPTQMFHSRWPIDGFGDNDQNARLIGAFFFDVV